MKAHLILVLAAGSLLAADGPGDSKKSDQKKLQGTWTAKSIEYGGEQVLGDNLKDLQIVIAGNKLSVKGESSDLDKYAKLTFKIDPGTTPKIIDVTISAGDEKGTVFEGIYELKGDKLKLCVQMFGKDRPGEFKSKSGSQTALAVFERPKP